MKKFANIILLVIQLKHVGFIEFEAFPKCELTPTAHTGCCAAEKNTLMAICS